MSARIDPAANPFDNVLRAALRALGEVVAPSVDTSDPLAQEQLRLVCKFLEMMRQRVGFIAEFQRARLDLALELAVAVSEHAGPCPVEVREGLAAALPHGRRVRDAAASAGTDMHAAAARLDALVSCALRHANRFEPQARQSIERAVLEHSAGSIDLQRAWHAPLGLDPDTASVPRLADALRTGNAAATT